MKMKKLTEFGGFQGDVLVRKLDSLPDNSQSTNERTVAWGEVTGHHHTVTGDVDAYRLPNGIAFVVEEGHEAYLVHSARNDPDPLIFEDHETLVMPPGIWFCPFDSQVEYDGATERRIAD